MSKSNLLFIRSAYNYDTAAASNESGLLCEDASLAQQQFKDDNNPNLIMEKFARTGDLSLLQTGGSPQFGDFTSAVDYRTSLDRVNEAKLFFSQLSAETRKRFDNDPAQFLEFFEDPKNLSEAIKLGLMKEGTTLPEPPLDAPLPNAKAPKGGLTPPGGTDADKAS